MHYSQQRAHYYLKERVDEIHKCWLRLSVVQSVDSQGRQNCVSEVKNENIHYISLICKQLAGYWSVPSEREGHSCEIVVPLSELLCKGRTLRLSGNGSVCHFLRVYVRCKLDCVEQDDSWLKWWPKMANDEILMEVNQSMTTQLYVQFTKCFVRTNSCNWSAEHLCLVPPLESRIILEWPNPFLSWSYAKVVYKSLQ